MQTNKRYQEFKEALKVRPIKIKKSTVEQTSATQDYIRLPDTSDFIKEMTRTDSQGMDAGTGPFQEDVEFRKKSTELENLALEVCTCMHT